MIIKGTVATTITSTCPTTNIIQRWLQRAKRELLSQIILLPCFNSNNISLLIMQKCYLGVRLCDCRNKNNKFSTTQPLQLRQRSSMSVRPWIRARMLAIGIWILTRARKAWREEVHQRMKHTTLWQGSSPRRISNRCSKVAVASSSSLQT